MKNISFLGRLGFQPKLSSGSGFGSEVSSGTGAGPVTTKAAGAASSTFDRTAKWLFAFAFAVITTSILVILKWGIHTRPEALMDPSSFDQPEAIGAAAFRRLFPELQSAQVVVIGTPGKPDWYDKTLAGFFAEANLAEVKYHLILVEAELPAAAVVLAAKEAGVLSENIRSIVFNTLGQEDIAELVRDARLKKQRVLILTANIYSSRLISNGPAVRFEGVLKKTSPESFVSISLAGLALQPSDEALIEPKCVGEAVDSTGTREFGCFLMSGSRTTYRKRNLARSRFTAIMRREPYTKDIILQIAVPQNK
jgi:hypothetical protein